MDFDLPLRPETAEGEAEMGAIRKGHGGVELLPLLITQPKDHPLHTSLPFHFCIRITQPLTLSPL
jgi:hypothetical protein